MAEGAVALERVSLGDGGKVKLIDCKQGSAAWFQTRCGRVTASEVWKTVDFLKKGDESAARRSYMAAIICEILTGEPDMAGYLTKYMQDGQDREPQARAEYELLTGLSVDQVGFVIHPTIERGGGSPDGLVGSDGLIEIKCPKTETHIDYIIKDEVPEDYKPQMYFNMVCCERSWCDFVSFDPRLPDALQVFVKRLPRDEDAIAALEDGVRLFLDEVDRKIDLLRRLRGEFIIAPPVTEQPLDDSYLTDEDLDRIAKRVI
jgi:YqaJ-like viral recombinase domain